MAIRFFLASNQYAAFLDQFYKKHPEHTQWSYAEHFRKQMNYYVGWGDLWQRHLPSDRYVVMQVQVNDKLLQTKWAKENGISFHENSWMIDILKAQVKTFTPDVYFAHDTHYISPEIRQDIIREIPSIKLVLGWDGIAMLDEKRFAGCDIVLSCSPFIAQAYSDMGKKGYLFRYAFEPELLNHLPERSSTIHPLSFAGSLTLGKGGHHYRLEVLGALAKKLPLEVWLSSFNKPDQIYFIKNLWRKCRAGEWSQVASILKLWQRNQGEVFGVDMFAVIRQSGVTINTHIDVARNQAANIRLFEATGCGACLVTDFKDNLSDYFEEDKEVIAYRNAAECVEKVTYLLEHPAEAEAVAKAGQKRTLTAYTYQRRVLEFADYLESILK